MGDGTPVEGLERTAATWERLAQRDPLWAVLVRPDKRGGRWSPEEFYATGEREIEALMTYVELVLPSLPRGDALDFGCGVGRLTLPLSGYFLRVTGLDISEGMLELARRRDVEGRCRFLVNRRPDLSLLPDASFDLVYSSITLQHVPPSAARSYIREFVRVLRPGGLAVFQLPEKRRLTLAGRLADLVPGLRRALSAGIEMHGAPREEVVGTLEAAGARVLDVQPDASGGARWPGFRYAATR